MTQKDRILSNFTKNRGHPEPGLSRFKSEPLRCPSKGHHTKSKKIVRLGLLRKPIAVRAFSLLVYTEQPLPTWLFLKKSHTSRGLTVQCRSENALGSQSQYFYATQNTGFPASGGSLQIIFVSAIRKDCLPVASSPQLPRSRLPVTCGRKIGG